MSFLGVGVMAALLAWESQLDEAPLTLSAEERAGRGLYLRECVEGLKRIDDQCLKGRY